MVATRAHCSTRARKAHHGPPDGLQKVLRRGVHLSRGAKPERPAFSCAPCFFFAFFAIGQDMAVSTRDGSPPLFLVQLTTGQTAIIFEANGYPR